MKSLLKNVTVALALFVAFTLAFSTTAKANDDENKNTAAELKFIGNYSNQPIFQLSLNNKEADEFTITFRDEDGTVLYTDRVKGTAITKKFMLNTEEVGNGSFSVEVKARKTNKVDTYTINRNRNYVDETVVTKLK
ncbi:MAG: hypothetical protein QM731_24575 [Chitinophagaceae bacterium]